MALSFRKINREIFFIRGGGSSKGFPKIKSEKELAEYVKSTKGMWYSSISSE